ncbi:cytochrome c oxidase subunit II [Halosolutus gelatinilyticus]|uniref:cytochrome c oxidase subunit II n=1 Tax=Halosolutus gelatinilyticus TaxID=2931975 RepID=UPI001FF115DD|nr:cytochrome c oxidase subunit II [Halosolutus gelatinilyticus]
MRRAIEAIGRAAADSPKRSTALARIAVFGSCSLAAVPFATESAAAQSVNRNLIESLHVRLLAIAVPLTLAVLAFLAYAAVRFREPAGANGAEPEPTPEKPSLEIAWVAATAAVLLVVALWAYPVLATPYLSPGGQSAGTEATPGAESNVTEIEVVASQWAWQFTYDEANVTTRNELVVPVDEEVRLVMTSRDVIHAFSIADLGVKRQVFPGEKTVIRTRVHERGEYRARCTAFCGARHAQMEANVTAVDRETYDAWLAEHEGETDPDPPDPPAG